MFQSGSSGFAAATHLSGGIEKKKKLIVIKSSSGPRQHASLGSDPAAQSGPSASLSHSDRHESGSAGPSATFSELFALDCSGHTISVVNRDGSIIDEQLSRIEVEAANRFRQQSWPELALPHQMMFVFMEVIQLTIQLRISDERTAQLTPSMFFARPFAEYAEFPVLLRRMYCLTASRPLMDLTTVKATLDITPKDAVRHSGVPYGYLSANDFLADIDRMLLSVLVVTSESSVLNLSARILKRFVSSFRPLLDPQTLGARELGTRPNVVLRKESMGPALVDEMIRAASVTYSLIGQNSRSIVCTKPLGEEYTAQSSCILSTLICRK